MVVVAKDSPTKKKNKHKKSWTINGGDFNYYNKEKYKATKTKEQQKI